MRILLVHPNYHSGGAEIAGNWPPAWAAYLSGVLRSVYDLGRINYWGPQPRNKVDFQFDRSRTLARPQTDDWEAAAQRSRKAVTRDAVVHRAANAVKACGADAIDDREGGLRVAVIEPIDGQGGRMASGGAGS